MKKSDIKPGDKVFYLDDIPATVRSVECNGVRIEYWGLGYQRETLKLSRVSASTLSPRENIYK